MLHLFFKKNAELILRKEVERRLVERLLPIRLEPKTILAITSNLKLLRQRFPKSKILKIDSPQTFLKSEIEPSSIDLLFANLLPWGKDELTRALAQFKQNLTSDGLLIFSMLGPDTLKELRQCSAQISDKREELPFIDMHEIGDILVQNHFTDPVIEMENITFTYTKSAKLLTELESLAKQYLFASCPKVLKRQLSMNYEKLRNSVGKLPVTFEIIYAHAWASSPKKDQPNEYSIALTAIKRPSRFKSSQ